MRTIFSAHKSKVLPTLIVVALLVCVMRAVVLSFHWKLIHDGITMQYIGLMLLDGVLPYRDIFDMNFPLTYWIHAVGITLLGKGDIATRSYDLLWCYFGAFAIAACIWRQNRALAIGAGLCFLMLHIGNGYMNQLQRDMYMAVFLSGGIFFVLIHPRPVIAGVLIGAACSIKPVAAIFALMMLLVHRPKNMIAYAVGLAIIPILSMSWMVGVGIFDEFLDVLLNFTLPVFASQAFEDTFQFRPEIPSYAVVAMILHVIAWRRKIFARKSLILIMGLIYGLLHYYLQRKGYNQHLYPFWAMVCVMMGVNLTLLAQQAFYSVWIGIALILTALFVSTPSTLWQKSAWFHDTPLIFMSESLEKEWMRENFPDPGEQVQILEDIFGTAWRLAYHYGWHPNMRFMYPFVLYAGKDHPVMKRYRQELVNSIIAAPPKYILLSSNSWPQYKRRVYKEFEGQPGLDYVLKQHYVVVIENRQTKLWQRKY